jgi:hypothetical protein
MSPWTPPGVAGCTRVAAGPMAEAVKALPVSQHSEPVLRRAALGPVPVPKNSTWLPPSHRILLAVSLVAAPVHFFTLRARCKCPCSAPA